MVDQFTVVSGSLDNWGNGRIERNYKYIHSFATLDEALTEWKVNQTYAFNEIEFSDENGKTWLITLTEKEGE